MWSSFVLPQIQFSTLTQIYAKCKITISFLFSAPDFVTSLEDGDYVYFFFREQAVEYINCGKVIFVYHSGCDSVTNSTKFPRQIPLTKDPNLRRRTYFLFEIIYIFPGDLSSNVPRESLHE